ncbi:hypothetical protein HOLleu_44626 [Holothuria leucospilota]|uniref:Uncharacterized protein n=1 Tax=Holothuria leucospilota TaxID=206669 RepID=A0A9Q0YC83_HOLLE|nr:hypothetical protein HOLleu_44626 [Holothuria leucospilota]
MTVMLQMMQMTVCLIVMYLLQRHQLQVASQVSLLLSKFGLHLPSANTIHLDSWRTDRLKNVSIRDPDRTTFESPSSSSASARLVSTVNFDISIGEYMFDLLVSQHIY